MSVHGSSRNARICSYFRITFHCSLMYFTYYYERHRTYWSPFIIDYVLTSNPTLILNHTIYINTSIDTHHKVIKFDIPIHNTKSQKYYITFQQCTQHFRHLHNHNKSKYHTYFKISATTILTHLQQINKHI